MTSWCPNKEDLLHLQATCPNIKSLKLLMNDKDIYDLAKILEEDCIDFDICQLGANYLLLFFFSCSLKTREKYISFAQFIYFLKEFNLLLIKFTIMSKKT